MSMGEIIDHIAQDTQSKENENTRKRYKGVCPVCGKENWICKSIAMEMGINTGHGACLAPAEKNLKKTCVHFWGKATTV